MFLRGLWLTWQKDHPSWLRDHLSSQIAPPCWLMEQHTLKKDDRGKLSLKIYILQAWFQNLNTSFQVSKKIMFLLLSCFYGVI